MNNLTAPLAVFAIGTTFFIAQGEPFGVILTGVISLLGYSLNKAGTR